MIPVSLSLKDFLSYGPELQTLSFTNLSLACLSGPNGAGKSALFDAITWALWGRARTRSNDALVRRGGKAALVDFEFEIGGATYRVRRSYTLRNGKHEAVLFNVSKPGDTEKELVEAQGVTAVAEAVGGLVRLPYDSFVASVYLKQGEAGFFTKSLRPRGRKELLFSLLGLDRFVALGEAASRAGRDTREALAREEAVAADLANELAAREETRRAAEAAEVNVRQAERAAEKAARGVAAAREKESRARTLQASFAAQKARLAELRGQMAAARVRKEEAAAALAAVEAITASREEITSAHDEYEEERRKLGELERKGQRWETLKRRLEGVLSRARERRLAAEKELAVAEERFRAAAEAVTTLEAEAAPRAELERTVRRLEPWRARYVQLKEGEKKYRAWERRLGEARNAYDKKVEGIRAKLAGLRVILKKWEGLAEKLSRARDAAARAEVERDAALLELETLEREEERTAEIAKRLAAAARDVELAAERFQSLQSELSKVGTGASTCPTCGRPFDEKSLARAQSHFEAELGREENLLKEREAQTARLRKESEAARSRLAGKSAVRQRFAAAQEALGGAIEEEAALRRTRAETETVENEAAASEGELRKLASSAEAKAVAEAEGELALAAFDEEAMEEAARRTEELTTSRHRLSQAARAHEMLSAALTARDADDAVRRRLRESLRGDFLEGVEREEAARLQGEISTLAFDAEALNSARRRTSGMAEAEVRFRDLKLAEEKTPLAREVYRRSSQELEKIELEDARLTDELAGAPDTDAALVEATAELQVALEEEKAAGDAKRRAAEELGAARAELARLERAAKRFAQVDAALKSRRRQLAVDRYLAAALGPDGIPALMTERALAELETEANAVLAGLTDGGMGMRLETQREKKTGGVAETLDVVLTDGGEPRPYDSFSGGEAFRADFSLRLGLSKLLARRAGVPLRFLVIDEGFGTQDEEGLTALVEAIARVKGDFDKILVISHLPELRDFFPCRVEVFRDGDGTSRFRVVT